MQIKQSSDMLLNLLIIYYLPHTRRQLSAKKKAIFKIRAWYHWKGEHVL